MASKPAIWERIDVTGSPSRGAGEGSPIELTRIAALLDALYCGALLVERSGRIAYVNRPLCDLMQRTPDELVGKSLEALYPSGAGRAVVDHALAHFDEPRQQEFFLPRADGTQLPVIVSGRRLEGAPPLNDHRIITVIDNSQQKLAE